MKNSFNRGLMAITLLCTILTPVFAQSFDAAVKSSTPVSEQVVLSNVVKYTNLDLSDPAIFAGKQFQIFVGLENTGEKAVDHTVAIYRKDATVRGGKVLMSSKQLLLPASQNTELTFTIAPESLIVKGQPAPDSFVFIIGGEEVEIDYVK